MSYRILESVENISSCLQSLKNVVKATNFYDNIFIGKHIDRFSVLYGGSRYFLYVLKDKSPTSQNFKHNIERIASLGDLSPFAKGLYYPQELKCVGRNNPFDYFDLILVENIEGVTLYDFLRHTINFSNSDINHPFSQLCQITRELIWLLESGLLFAPFNSDAVGLYGKGCYLLYSDSVKIEDRGQCKESDYELFIAKVGLAILSSWLLFFKDDENYRLNDALLEFIQDFDVIPLLSTHYLQLQKVAEQCGVVLGVDLSIVVAKIYHNDEVVPAISPILCSLLEVDLSQVDSCWSSSVLSPIDNYFNDTGFELCSAVIENRVVIKEQESGLYGYSDNYGNIVCEPIFVRATPFFEGVAVVEDGRDCFAINREGEPLFRAFYNYLEWHGEFNLFVAEHKRCWMLLNRMGERLTKRDYSWIGEFSSKRAVVELSETHLKGYIDVDGREILEPKYDNAEPFSNDIGVVELQGVVYNVMVDGTVVKSLDFDLDEF